MGSKLVMVHIRLSYELLRRIDHLAVDWDVFRGEAMERLLYKGLETWQKDREAKMDGEKYKAALEDVQQSLYDALRMAPVALLTGSSYDALDVLVGIEQEVLAILQRHDIEPVSVVVLEGSQSLRTLGHRIV